MCCLIFKCRICKSKFTHAVAVDEALSNGTEFFAVRGKGVQLQSLQLDLTSLAIQLVIRYRHRWTDERDGTGAVRVLAIGFELGIVEECKKLVVVLGREGIELVIVALRTLER